MINYIVFDVILTSILTSAIVAALVFWLLIRNYNETYKSRIDEIMEKIKNQSNSFTAQVDGLKSDLKRIIEMLNRSKKNKT